MTRATLRTVVWTNNKAKRLAIRVTKWTGKSREYVHPKHLLATERYWYLGYVRGHVLDVGCGHGAHALKAARRALHVIALDGDREALAIAQRTASALEISNITWLAVDIEQALAVGRGWADTILCLDVLEHVVARDQLLQNMRAALRPGGVLLLAVPNRATSWKRRLERAGLFSYADPDHKTEYTRDELDAELARNGFRITRLYPSVYDTPLVGLVDLIGSVSLRAYARLTALRRRLAERYPDEGAGFYAVCEMEEGKS